ncbi:hypothetical protein COT82_02230 [Candidatus Campbellbacteria bacterium CG10_big_fil_rev_8_21_14_0_10_35_52]|uniref:Uncharacterized protein n=1 Tax=Candidatus Campbellbacteria bacterium CG10_big_fil_rev_8_21_14_0_10_35_52 TaxID=1974527 RepID=A0A2M6WV08_9BACT|nr:MAG: hypothetical protein COT82_02230 [Candidatus Campbellbacteria bacterium CG10_big_fil_rev_8_21_14_0_10_35_52]
MNLLRTRGVRGGSGLNRTLRSRWNAPNRALAGRAGKPKISFPFFVEEASHASSTPHTRRGKEERKGNFLLAPPNVLIYY